MATLEKLQYVHSTMPLQGSSKLCVIGRMNRRDGSCPKVTCDWGSIVRVLTTGEALDSSYGRLECGLVARSR